MHLLKRLYHLLRQFSSLFSLAETVSWQCSSSSLFVLHWKRVWSRENRRDLVSVESQFQRFFETGSSVQPVRLDSNYFYSSTPSFTFFLFIYLFLKLFPFSTNDEAASYFIFFHCHFAVNKPYRLTFFPCGTSAFLTFYFHSTTSVSYRLSCHRWRVAPPRWQRGGIKHNPFHIPAWARPVSCTRNK